MFYLKRKKVIFNNFINLFELLKIRLLMPQIISSEKVEKKKTEILNAARVVFLRYGYKKSTMVDIAKEIGLNQASLYYYFNNKEEIFVESLLAEFNDFKERVRTIITEKSPIQEKIISFFNLKLKFFYENPISQQISDLNPKKISEPHKKQIYNLNERERTLIKSLLEKAIQKGEFISIDTFQLTDILIHLFQGIRFGTQFKYFLSKKNPNLDDMKAELEQSIKYLLKSILRNERNSNDKQFEKDQ
jgi:AcrR family transcriptional regulator